MPKPRLLPGASHTTHVRMRLDHWPSTELPPIVSNPAVDQGNYSVSPLSLTKYRDSWIVDVSGLTPDTEYEFGINPPLVDVKTTVTVRTLPADLTHSLVLALFSCFFPSEQYVSRPGIARDMLKTIGMPHLKVFTGDQIYGDVPGTYSLDTEVYGLRYRQAFQNDRMGNLLSYGANLFTCDDHEFWNSYPESAFWLDRSRDKNWQRWAREACDEFFLNQGILNFVPGLTEAGNPGDPFETAMNGLRDRRCWFSGMLAGLDFFMTDTRSDRMSRDGDRRTTGIRQSGERRMLSDNQREALKTWIDNVKRVGLLVLGQPLLLNSEYYDNAMCDYDEYTEFLKAIARNLRQRNVTYIVLTGDIHWGRLASLSPRHRPTSRLIEFCASPVARVGVRSIVSSSYDVGERSPVNFDYEDSPEEFRDCFSDFVHDRSFATNDNNFGLIRFAEVAGHIQAGFELWSLDTQDLAIDRWGTNNGLRCRRTLDLT